MDEAQILNAVCLARQEIEDRLNQLERVTGRTVIRMELQRLNVTTAADSESQWLRTVDLEIAPAPGQIG